MFVDIIFVTAGKQTAPTIALVTRVCGDMVPKPIAIKLLVCIIEGRLLIDLLVLKVGRQLILIVVHPLRTP